MSIKSVKRKYASGTGVGEFTNRSYTIVFEVWTTSADDGIITVGNATGIPHYGDYYTWGAEADTAALCTSVTPRQITATLWEVTCQYKNNHGDPQTGKAIGDSPLDQPVRRRWDTMAVTFTPDKDLEGAAFINSAGCAFDSDLVAIEEQRPVLTIVRNEAYFDYGTAASYNNSINAEAFYGWDAGKAKLAISGEEKFTDNMAYAEVTYRIEFNRLGWQKKLLDCGPFSIKDGTTDTKIYPTDENGVASTVSVKLNGAGVALAADGEPVYLTFTVYESKSWGVLNL
jgi:hypothetical protein